MNWISKSLLLLEPKRAQPTKDSHGVCEKDIQRTRKIELLCFLRDEVVANQRAAQDRIYTFSQTAGRIREEVFVSLNKNRLAHLS